MCHELRDDLLMISFDPQSLQAYSIEIVSCEGLDDVWKGENGGHLAVRNMFMQGQINCAKDVLWQVTYFLCVKGTHKNIEHNCSTLMYRMAALQLVYIISSDMSVWRLFKYWRAHTSMLEISCFRWEKLFIGTYHFYFIRNAQIVFLEMLHCTSWWGSYVASRLHMLAEFHLHDYRFWMPKRVNIQECWSTNSRELLVCIYSSSVRGCQISYPVIFKTPSPAPVIFINPIHVPIKSMPKTALLSALIFHSSRNNDLSAHSSSKLWC